jgi:PilZ domain
MGLGQNLAIALVDVSEDGLGLRLKAALGFGEEITIELNLPGVGKPLKLVADVRWCTALGDGSFHVGVKLRRRLMHGEVSNLN